MTTFTVLGYYVENFQPWGTSVMARDYIEAEGLAKNEIARVLLYEQYTGEELDAMGEGEVQHLIEELALDLDYIRSTGVVEGDHAIQGGDFEHGA